MAGQSAMTFHEGMWVWAKDDTSVWSPVRIAEVNNDSYFDVVTLGGNSKKMHAKDIHSVASWNCFDEEMQGEYFHSDLSKMTSLNTPAVLYSLRAMYECGVFYRKLGSGTILAINPFQEFTEMFNRKMILAYHRATMAELGAMPAHVFSVVERARRDMEIGVGLSNQSIVISGESGAGKTWTVSCLMHYLTYIGIDTNNNEMSNSDEPVCTATYDIDFPKQHQIEKRILSSNPVLEAFGNAATARNHNSSRFGKYIQLQYDRSGHIAGATLQIYLLEKTRVAKRDSAEKNFHIFYQLVNGTTPEERSKFCLDVDHFEAGDNSNINSNVSLKKSTHSNLGDFNGQQSSDDNFMETETAFSVTKKAMLAIGISAQKQCEIFKVLSALLHLSNVELEGDDDFNPCVPSKNCQLHLKVAAFILAVPVNRLVQSVTVRRIEAGRKREGKRRSVVKKSCTKQECAARMEALMKSIYEMLFHWIVSEIVSEISAAQDKVRSFIGLLDIYGFESFQRNGLEQLCINYANEKLQHYYVENFLKQQQEELSHEHIIWNTSELVDKIECLRVLESPQNSLFSLLNEECRLNRSTNAVQLMNRIFQTFKKDRFISKPYKAAPCFVVSHYANKVEYTTDSLIAKNKDELPAEIVELLLDSKNEFLNCLLQQKPDLKTNYEANKGKHNKTVLRQFKLSLDNLLKTMASTNCHYIRCIKPNEESLPKRFDSFHVVEQLKSSGIIETIQVCGHFLPHKMRYQQFLNNFSFLLSRHPNANIPKDFQHISPTEKCELIMKNLSNTYAAIDFSSSCQFGSSSIFLSAELYEILHKERVQAMLDSVKTIIPWWRALRAKWFCREERAILIAQRNEAASCFQRSWRLRQLKAKLRAIRSKEICRRNAAASTIQAFYVAYKNAKKTRLEMEYLLPPTTVNNQTNSFIESEEEECSFLSVSHMPVKYASVQVVRHSSVSNATIQTAVTPLCFLPRPQLLYSSLQLLLCSKLYHLYTTPIRVTKSAFCNLQSWNTIFSTFAQSDNTQFKVQPILPFSNVVPKCAT